VKRAHVKTKKITSFGLLEDKEMMVTDFKYVSLANCGLRNSVTQLF
jgi:hypothetical protein